MEVDASRRVLWVASSHAGKGMPMIDMTDEEQGSAGVFKFDLTSGRLIRKYVLAGEPQRHFFNDLTVSSDGPVYITDGSASAVYRVASDTDSLELFVQPEDMPSPNGITMSDDGGHLFVALRGDIGKVSVATRSLSMVARPEGISVGADGLYFRNRSLITVWPGKERHGVTRYTMNAALDTIETIEPVIQEHASFAQPTTGVIVGADIYVVANSQLQVFSRLYAAGGAIDTGVLEVPAILRVSLAR
jgi:sugar lactone lactonase YvrE